MKTNYTITVKGTVNNIASFLTDFVERQSTNLNKNYDLKIKELRWATNSPSDSLARGSLSIASKCFSKADLGDIRETYNVKLILKKVA